MDTLTHPAPPRPQAIRPHELAAAALVMLALALTYAPSWAYLSQVWAGDPNYSYGYFIIPIALGILWVRRGRLDRARLAPAWWGWVLLVGVLALRSYFYQINERWCEDATIPLAVAGLALGFGGWPLLRWALPAIIFLGFMLPLPNRANLFLAYRLQAMATVSSVAILQALGLPALAEGNVVHVGLSQLEVARACSGLSMLLTFLALITAAAIVVDRPLLDRAVLLASAVPIALAANILRIAITALCYYWAGTDELRLPVRVPGLGPRLPHDWVGYLMPVMGLGLALLELRLLAWLIVEEEEGPAAPDPLAALGPARPGARRPAGR